VREIGLGYLELTFLVINAYAAAMVGRLVSLPRTFVGAMILGLAQAYFLLGLLYVPSGASDVVASLLSGIRSSLPTLLLLLTMLLLPQEKLRVGSVAGTKLTPVPSRARALRTGAVFLVGVGVLMQVMDTSRIAAFAAGLAFALIMLSLVLLAGYGGDVSLGQMAFVGVGALLVARVFGTAGPAAMLGAFLVCAVIGALVALPTLRLRGLYLGLGTLAFAFAMDKLVFENPQIGFDLGAVALIERPQILGVSLAGERAFAVFTAVAFVLVSLGLLELRRGRFGRLLLAARDSPAACSTLGTSVSRIRVVTFALAAGLAGFAGVFLAGVNLAVGPTDFTMFQNLPLLLLLVIGGVTSITGALIGGMLLGFAPAISGGDQAVGFAMNVPSASPRPSWSDAVAERDRGAAVRTFRVTVAGRT
jgi:branched-chain amino acid transport system permease protein